MTLTKYLQYGLGIVFVLAVVYMFSSAGQVSAGVSVYTPSNCYLNATTSPATAYGAATTTVAYLSPGAATTTSLGCFLGPDGTDSAILALQLTGSTTPLNSFNATTTYAVVVEYSQDGVDWYYNGNIATTTKVGTQTLSGVLVSSTTPTRVYVDVPTPTRYIRAVLSIPQGSTNGAVWAQFLPKQQVN